MGKSKKVPIVISIVCVFVVCIIVGIILLEVLRKADLPFLGDKEPKTHLKFDDEKGTITDGETGFVYDNKDNKPLVLSVHNSDYILDTASNSLLSYNANNGDRIEFNQRITLDSFTDTLTYGGKILSEKTVFKGGMYIDAIDYKNFLKTIEYGKDNRIESITVSGDIYDFKYSDINSNGVKSYGISLPSDIKPLDKEDNLSTSELPLKIYRNSKLIKEYQYNSLNQIIFEADYETNLAYGYIYADNRLTEKKFYRIFEGLAINYLTTDISTEYESSGDSLIYDSFNFRYSNGTLKGVNETELEYGYSYNGNELLTQKIQNGIVTDYSYINDKVTSEITAEYSIGYILDNQLNYSGLDYNGNIYYYGFDIFGNINSILDENGLTVVEYNYSALGELLNISGKLSGTLGIYNSIIFNKNLYDHENCVYYNYFGIYDPDSSITVSNKQSQGFKYALNQVSNPSENYLTAPINKSSALSGKVLEVVKDYFNRERIETLNQVYITDSEYNITGLTDIFTLPYELAPFSFANVLNGNQVYFITTNSTKSLNFIRERLNNLCDEEADELVGGVYKPAAGTVEFNGQFVYLGSLVKYKSLEAGIISFEILEDKPENYNKTLNCYSYDYRIYSQFIGIDFNVDMFKGVTLIAGINQEKYNTIQNFFDVKAAEIYETERIIREYIDANAGKDYSEDFIKNVERKLGPPQYLTIDANGNVQVAVETKKYTFWDFLGDIGYAVYVSPLIIGTGIAVDYTMLVGAKYYIIGSVIGNLAGGEYNPINDVINFAINNGNIVGFWEHALHPLKNVLAYSNYNHNILQNIPTSAYSGDYINNQNVLSSFKYGTTNIDNGGCGIIAAYNALLALNKLNGRSFQQIIFEMEQYTAAAGSGLPPGSLCDYLKTQRITYARQDATSDNYIGFVGKHIEGLKEGQKAVFAMAYWNNQTIEGGSHFVMFTVDGSGILTSYNGSRLASGSYEIRLNTFFGGQPRPLSLIYVGRTQV